MNNKTFGIVVGVIIALALAMFAGLYMLGMAGNNPNAFNDGYEYEYEDANNYFDDADYGDDFTEYYPDFADGDFPETYDDFLEGGEDLYEDDGFYFDEEGNAYNFDDFEFEDLNYDSTTINLETQ